MILHERQDLGLGETVKGGLGTVLRGEEYMAVGWLHHPGDEEET